MILYFTERVRKNAALRDLVLELSPKQIPNLNTESKSSLKVLFGVTIGLNNNQHSYKSGLIRI